MQLGRHTGAEPVAARAGEPGRDREVVREPVDERHVARQRVEIGAPLAAGCEAAALQEMHELVCDRVQRQPVRVEPELLPLELGEAGRTPREADLERLAGELGKNRRT